MHTLFDGNQGADAAPLIEPVSQIAKHRQAHRTSRRVPRTSVTILMLDDFG
jgi:hypothetical protein